LLEGTLGGSSTLEFFVLGVCFFNVAQELKELRTIMNRRTRQKVFVFIFRG
jgi:hypothetical protein